MLHEALLEILWKGGWGYLSVEDWAATGGLWIEAQMQTKTWNVSWEHWEVPAGDPFRSKHCLLLDADGIDFSTLPTTSKRTEMSVDKKKKNERVKKIINKYWSKFLSICCMNCWKIISTFPESVKVCCCLEETVLKSRCTRACTKHICAGGSLTTKHSA